MRDALFEVLGKQEEEAGVTRILATAFFRSPRAEAPSASVISLAERRRAVGGRAVRELNFLGGGRQ
jgi:hypothetical protein